MTVTSSVTSVGITFQGVIVKTSVTEIATTIIARNFSCGVFLYVAFLFPIIYDSQYLIKDISFF